MARRRGQGSGQPVYGLRNRVHESSEPVTFVTQHTLAISRFPVLIRWVKQQLPESSYRVLPANYEECEALFYNEADLLLFYQTSLRHFDFSPRAVRKLELGEDRLIPVAAKRLAARLGELVPGMVIPLLMYQQGGFLAEALSGSRLPELIRDYRVESICESAFSASLREMALAVKVVEVIARQGNSR